MESAPTLSPVKQAALKQRLRQATDRSPRRAEIPKRPDARFAPLSFAQSQMWVIDQMTPGNPAYNLPYGFRLRGPLDVTALYYGFNEIIKRHESLRTTFAVKDGEPRQEIHPELRIQILLTSLEHLAGEERERKLQSLASEESIKPFDLSRLPLIRVSLFKLAEAEHILIVNLHHIVADGLSIALLMRELDVFYRAFTEGRDEHLPELAVHYGDYALWQRQTFAADSTGASQIDYWRKQLGGTLPVLELPGDKPRPALQSFKGANVLFDVPVELTQALKSLSAREGGTFFMAALAVFQVLLQRYSGAEDIVIGTPVGVRTRPEFEPLIGNFLNMVALRCDVSGDPTFLELLRRSRDTALDAYSNGNLPFAALMEQLKFARDPGRNAIFQVGLQLLSMSTPRLGNLEVSSFFFDLKFAQFDLSLDLYEEAGGTVGRFEYCADLFEPQSIRRMCNHFVTLLEAIIREPAQRISRLPIFSAAERHQLLVEWNDTTAAAFRQVGGLHEGAGQPADQTSDRSGDGLFHELIAAQAARTPDAVAVRCAGCNLSYRELDRRANQLAHALRQRGVGPDVLVGLCVNRSANMIVALLGVLKAGGAYVPLDPEYPVDRLAFFLEDCGASVLITESDVRQSLPLQAPGRELLDLDRDAQLIARQPQAPPPANVDASHLAYAIYTSGSTGRPKAALLTHRGLANLAAHEFRLFGVGPQSRVLQFSSLSFDTSLSEIAMALCSGATLHVERRDQILPGPELESYLLRERITVLSITPSALAVLDPNAAASVEQVIVGGEPCPAPLAARWAGRCRFFNAYGPTETSITATCIEYRDGVLPPLIGRPLPNVRVYVLDPKFQLVPVGVTGELYIGGVGVARGYLNRPEATEGSFLSDPFSGQAGARLYRSGDFVRWRSDGQIEFVGRKDDQVKLRGFRIELGEIESGLARHPAVREVAVIAREDTPGDKRLVAYLVVEKPPADLVEQLRALVRSTLPEYMLPAQFVLLDKMPRTPNGKLDRKALPAPTAEDEAPRNGVAAPRTPTEEMVAAAFRGVLGHNHFGVRDNFFDLGGHSLMAARLLSTLRAASGAELSLRDLFTRPTVAGLAEAIDALQWLQLAGAPGCRTTVRDEVML